MTTSTTTEATISEAQRKANQVNAQASTGPRTPEGKARSRMNARRHGLTGQFSVMSEDDERAYKTWETGILEALAPVGTYERDLAICIVQNRWRLHRARALESNIFGLGHNELADGIDAPTAEVEVAVTQGQTWLNHHPALTNMTLYETRIERTIAHNKRELDALQATRKAAEAQAREEAEVLLANQLAQDEQNPIDTSIEVNGAAKSGLIPTPALEQDSIQVNGAPKSGLIPTHVLHQDKIEVNGFVFSTTKIIAGLTHKRRVEAARRATQHPVKPQVAQPITHPKAA